MLNLRRIMGLMLRVIIDRKLRMVGVNQKTLVIRLENYSNNTLVFMQYR